MSPEDIQKLLGGYATGTLTPQEQQALFAAALTDQNLFDALAREQSLRDLLRDPAAKAELLCVLEEKAAAPVRWWDAPWWRPAMSAAGMAGLVALALVLVWQGRPSPKSTMVAVAELRVTPLNSDGPRAEIPAAPNPAPVANGPQQAPREREAVLMKDQAAAAPPVAQTRQAPAPPAAKSEPAAPPPPRDEKAVSPAAPESASVGAVSSNASVPAPVAEIPLTPPGTRVPPPVRVEVAAASGFLEPDGAVDGSPRSLFYQQPMLGRVQSLASATAGVTETTAAADKPAAEAKRKKAAAQPERRTGVVGGVVGFAPAPIRAAGQQGGAPAPAFARPLAAPVLGLRYTTLRLDPDGEFVEVDPTQLNRGDVVRLSFVSNDSGFLYVTATAPDGVSREVLSGPVDRLKPVATPTLRADERELAVLFTRQPRVVSRDAAGGGGGGRSDSVSAPLIQRVAAERATYAVAPGAQQLRLNITVNYR